MEDVCERTVIDMLLEDKDSIGESATYSSSSTLSTSSEDSESDSDIKLFSEKDVRITNYIETMVVRYRDNEFKEHFRMTRDTSEYLIGKLSDTHIMASENSCGRPAITPRKGLLVTLWYLANTETYRQVSDRFDLGKGTVYAVVTKVAQYFISVSSDYIKWPTVNRITEIENEFFEKSGMHGIIGAIDGSHIRIKKPFRDQEAYCNRKGYHSVILQAICDEKKRFIDIFCGEAGSQHDARVLRKSGLYAKGCDNQLNIGNNFVLGDSAYPILGWLVPPFKEDRILTQNHHRFNYRHSSVRIVIEHSFGLLKNRFRRLLHGFDNNNVDFIVSCILCACVFHNISITFDDLNIEYELQNDRDDEPEPEQQNERVDVLPQRNRRDLLFHEMFP